MIISGVGIYMDPIFVSYTHDYILDFEKFHKVIGFVFMFFGVIVLYSCYRLNNKRLK